MASPSPAGKTKAIVKASTKVDDVVDTAKALDRTLDTTKTAAKQASLPGPKEQLLLTGSVEKASETQIVNVNLSKSKYPESAQHINDAIKNGQPEVLTINRVGAEANRQESLKNINKIPGSDLDEYPPAMFKEGGSGASILPISPSDNRGAGATIGNQLRIYPDGTIVKINIID
jgi:hypothetical protein